tara:strand:+ start:282 stop:1487 length:1206 start_codon:yes stop_codon:yes gene_type:complete
MNHDSYNSHIIPSPETVRPRNDHSQIIIVDSKDRNKFLYKNSNNYVAELNSQFYNVTEVELISMYYKFSNYEFNNNNNKLFITNNTTSDNLSISLGIGNYTTEKMITHLTYKFNSYCSIKNINYEITPKYSSILDRFYFSINNTDKFTLNFKGSEKRYPSTLYGNTATNTNIFSYKNNTNGVYFGFSENDFSNTYNLFSMKIETTNTTDKIHKITLTIKDKTSYYNLINVLNTQDTDMQIYFENSNNGINTSYTILYNDLIGHEVVSDESISVTLKLSENINNLLIINPIFYTNIVMGDIIRSDIKDSYVLLDIQEFNRLESLNSNIQNSYVKIPVNQNEHIYFDNTKNHGTIKYFNPILKKLDRLTIKIKDRDGNILDSNGLNHTMVFAVKSLNSKNNLA